MKTLELTGARSTELQGQFAADPVAGANGGREERWSFEELVEEGSDFTRDLATDGQMSIEQLMPAATNDPSSGPDQLEQAGLGRAQFAHRLTSPHKQKNEQSDEDSGRSELSDASALRSAFDPREGWLMSLDPRGSQLSATTRETPTIGNAEPVKELSQKGSARSARQAGWASDPAEQGSRQREMSEPGDYHRTDVSDDGEIARPELSSICIGWQSDLTQLGADAGSAHDFMSRADSGSIVDRVVISASSAKGVSEATSISKRSESHGGAMSDTPVSQVVRREDPKYKAGRTGHAPHLHTLQPVVVARRNVAGLNPFVESSRREELTGNARSQGGDGIGSSSNVTIELSNRSPQSGPEMLRITSVSNNTLLERQQNPVFRRSAILLAHIEVDRMTDRPQIGVAGDMPQYLPGQREQDLDERRFEIASTSGSGQTEQAGELTRTSRVADELSEVMVFNTTALPAATASAGPNLIHARVPTSIAWRSMPPVGHAKESSLAAIYDRAVHDPFVIRSLPMQLQRNEVTSRPYSLTTPSSPQPGHGQSSILPEANLLNDSDQAPSVSPDPISLTFLSQVAAAIRESLPVSQPIAATPSSSINDPNRESRHLGIHQLSVEVDTADLGKVSVSLGRRGDQLSIELTTEGQETAGIVGAGLSALSEALKLEGLDVHSITVRAPEPQSEDRPDSAMTHQSSFAQARGDSQSGQDGNKAGAGDRGLWQANSSLKLQPESVASESEAMPPHRGGRTVVI